MTRDRSVDAAFLARAALASDMLALPRSRERREALRLLLVVRRSAVDVRREALTQLRAVIVTAPDRLRDELRGLPVGKLLDRCSRFVAWSHPGRLRSEAAFARLAGVAPVPASSGRTTRRRLSRGGDRQLNRALHTKRPGCCCRLVKTRRRSQWRCRDQDL